jgi:acyl carrier protein
MSSVGLDQVRRVLGDVLQLGPRVEDFDRDTALLGNLPELDSMAVVSVISALEEQFGVVIEDDDINAEAFEKLGSLVDWLNAIGARRTA